MKSPDSKSKEGPQLSRTCLKHERDKKGRLQGFGWKRWTAETTLTTRHNLEGESIVSVGGLGAREQGLHSSGPARGPSDMMFRTR